MKKYLVSKWRKVKAFPYKVARWVFSIQTVIRVTSSHYPAHAHVIMVFCGGRFKKEAEYKQVALENGRVPTDTIVEFAEFSHAVRLYYFDDPFTEKEWDKLKKALDKHE